MDAEAYLTGLGWRGKGHSLDAHDRGLSRPLLVKHKQDTHGVGKKKHNHADQWWARAFDSSLKGLDLEKNAAAAAATQDQSTGEDGTTTKATTTAAIDLTKNPRWFGGLYGFFVKGEGLKGTIAHNLASEKGPGKTKRKREIDDDNVETEEERRERKERKKKSREQKKKQRDKTISEELMRCREALERAKYTGDEEERLLLLSRARKSERLERWKEKRAKKYSSAPEETSDHGTANVDALTHERRRRRRERKLRRQLDDLREEFIDLIYHEANSDMSEEQRQILSEEIEFLQNEEIQKEVELALVRGETITDVEKEVRRRRRLRRKLQKRMNEVQDELLAKNVR